MGVVQTGMLRETARADAVQIGEQVGTTRTLTPGAAMRAAVGVMMSGVIGTEAGASRPEDAELAQKPKLWWIKMQYQGCYTVVGR